MTTQSTRSIDCSTKGNHEDVAVIIGRFQTPYLHAGHKDLIARVANAHKQVVVLLGVSPNKRSRRNPLDFEARRIMILQDFPNVTVLPLSDMKDDDTWSRQVDSKLREIYPFASIRLYGGRDSFIAHYLGSYPTTEIEANTYTSATCLRDQAGHDVKESPAWRAGVIYGAYNQYPKCWPTVDIAPIRLNEDGSREVLLARKPGEREWRFIGGFVDPTDTRLEHAAIREVSEEAGIECSAYKYICSLQIDDWRYRDDVDKVMTTFFEATYQSGHPQPQDDIEELAWYTFDNGPRSFFFVKIVSAHMNLYRILDLRAEQEGWYAKGVTHQPA